MTKLYPSDSPTIMIVCDLAAPGGWDIAMRIRRAWKTGRTHVEALDSECVVLTLLPGVPHQLRQ